MKAQLEEMDARLKTMNERLNETLERLRSRVDHDEACDGEEEGVPGTCPP